MSELIPEWERGLLDRQTAEIRDALESLADAGHLDRQHVTLDDCGCEVEHDPRVGWYVKGTGDRATAPVRVHVAYVSGWLPVDDGEVAGP